MELILIAIVIVVILFIIAAMFTSEKLEHGDDVVFKDNYLDNYLKGRSGHVVTTYVTDEGERRIVVEVEDKSRVDISEKAAKLVVKKDKRQRREMIERNH